MHSSIKLFLLLGQIYQLHSNTIRPDVAVHHQVGRSSFRAASYIVESCPNVVYCQGDLLDTVQRQKLYPDSKTFVDMSQKNDEATTLANFEAMMNSTNRAPTKEDIRRFVDANFEFIDESENWSPPDYQPSPAFLNKIQSKEVRTFAENLVHLWPMLGRRVKSSVEAEPSRHSLIPLPEGFIVPGGRFREIYYWDSYWIIQGLLISEMTTTVKGMLDNFIYLIKQYGLIPNGSRIYYLNRSQPPLFTSMVGLYLDHTGDLNWLKANVGYIEKELQFWLDNRILQITRGSVSYQLAHYGTNSNTPRPESYAEDVATCSYTVSEKDRLGCYNALKTAAETGWDFSTRLIFDKDGGTKANLSSIDSQRVIPVDLNAFLCKSFRLLSDFYGRIGNVTKQAEWRAKATEWQQTIDILLYNEADGIWYDYDYDLDRQRKYFFPSNFATLWADCYDQSKKLEFGKRAVNYFNNQGIHNFMGGIPMSLEESGEQWDLPNAWPPLQDIVVMGLYKTNYVPAQEVARTFAHRWIDSNVKGYEATKAMYEKYNAITPGLGGGGGEYEVQLGFGWSNGVVLSFINQFSSGVKTNPLYHLIILSILIMSLI